MWRLDKGGEGVDDVAIVPLPAEDDFFVGLEISGGKYAEGAGIGGAKDGAKDSVGSAVTLEVARIVACLAVIEGEVEGGTNEADKGLGHAEVQLREK